MNRLNNILLTLLFLALALGQLQRLPGLPFYVHDLILGAILLVNRRRLILYRPVLWFGLAGIISLLGAGFRLPLNQVLTGSLYLVRFLVYSLIIGVKIDSKYLIGLSTALASFGLFQYLFIPDTRWLFNLNWDEHYYRLISTLYDPNFTAIMLVLGLILIYREYRHRYWLYGLHLAALLLTYSRSGYLALAAAILTTAVIKRQLKLILVIIMFLAALFFLPRPGGEGVKLERIQSIAQRFSNYRLGWQFWQMSPVIGLGFDTLRYYRDNQLSHSASGLDASLQLVLVTTGVAGLMVYLNLLLNLWRQSQWLKITMVALLVNSLFINSLFYPWVMLWLWSVIDQNDFRGGVPGAVGSHKV